MIITCYVIPVFMMFASTFKVLIGLSLAIVLARFFAWSGALRQQPRNLRNGDSSLAKLGIILVSCSCGKWGPIDADEPETASAINQLLYSEATMVLYYIFCTLLGISVSSWCLIS